MGEHLTAEQLRQQYIEAMGQELGLLHSDLVRQLSQLHFKWRQYRDLYGTTPERVALLNQTSPLFFARLQTILLEDVLLHLTRLTDKPRMNERDNITVKLIPRLIQDIGLKSEIEALVVTVENKCEGARRWRNRRMAHTDLLTHREVDRLPDMSRDSVELALEALRNVLNRLERHYLDSTVGYEWGVEAGGVDSLLYHLERSLSATRGHQ